MAAFLPLLLGWWVASAHALPIYFLPPAGTASTNPIPVLGMRADLTNTVPVTRTLAKPARFATYTERLEFIHANVSPTLEGHVLRADAFFRSETNRLENPPVSRFRVSFTGKTSSEGKDVRFTLTPTFDADVELPSLEHQWKLYLRSRSHDLLPGVDDSDRNQGTHIGISRMAKKLDIESDAGVRMRNPPVAFAQLKWDPLLRRNPWVFRPVQRLFAESGEGLGTVTSFSSHRWWGPRKNRFVQSLTSVRLTQRSEGWEGEQTFRIGHVDAILEGTPSWERLFGDRNVARGQYLRFSLFGHSEEVTSHDATRLGFVIRRPWHRKWIYLQVTPELQWTRDNAWRTEYLLKVSADLLFWGTEER